ncbi:hypothetical protein [Peterkaempfera bronchialis]|uniref:hypothetical protein n=1 Tax=Peterkaempfera bronchialis TaxID=2126346 RepID=UPI0013B467DC|nr:hypothetical protein [Peterkaempfera bronchialis]
MTVQSPRAESAPAAAIRPAPLVAGAVIALVQGAALAVWGGYDVIAGLTGSPHNRGLAEFGGVVILLMGVLPLLAGRGLLRFKRWGRTPALLTDSLCLPVAYYMWQTGGAMTVAAVLIALLGLAGIAALLHPKVTAVLETPRT